MSNHCLHFRTLFFSQTAYTMSHVQNPEARPIWVYSLNCCITWAIKFHPVFPLSILHVMVELEHGYRCVLCQHSPRLSTALADKMSPNLDSSIGSLLYCGHLGYCSLFITKTKSLELPYRCCTINVFSLLKQKCASYDRFRGAKLISNPCRKVYLFIFKLKEVLKTLWTSVLLLQCSLVCCPATSCLPAPHQEVMSQTSPGDITH